MILSMKSIVLITLLGFFFSPLLPASTIVIDDFIETLAPVTADATQDGTMLGGERDLAMIFPAALTSGQFEVSGGEGTLSAVNTDDDGENYMRIIYDGEDDQGDAMAFGLPGVDLTDGGDNDRFLVHLTSVTGSIKVQLRVWSGPVDFSLYEFTDVTVPGMLEIPFSSLVPVGGTLDLTSVVQVSLMVGIDDNEGFSVTRIAATNEVGLDTTLPTASIDGKSKVTVTARKVKLRGGATDNLAIGRVEVREGTKAYRTVVHTGTATSARWSYRSKKLKEGTTTFKVRSVDANGNLSAIDKVKVKRG
jgi:hypothetical protein